MSLSLILIPNESYSNKTIVKSSNITIPYLNVGYIELGVNISEVDIDFLAESNEISRWIEKANFKNARPRWRINLGKYRHMECFNCYIPIVCYNYF